MHLLSADSSFSIIGVDTDHIHLMSELDPPVVHSWRHLEALELPGIALPASGLDSAGHNLIDANNFLLHLKKFKSRGCLGVCSRLFEEKQTLVHLSLFCSHISTAASKLNRDQVFYDNWQNLHHLEMISKVNLSPSSLPTLIHRLKKLKVLTLPERILQTLQIQDRPTVRFIAKLKDQFPNRNISIKVIESRTQGILSFCLVSCLFYIINYLILLLQSYCSAMFYLNLISEYKDADNGIEQNVILFNHQHHSAIFWFVSCSLAFAVLGSAGSIIAAFRRVLMLLGVVFVMSRYQFDGNHPPLIRTCK